MIWLDGNPPPDDSTEAVMDQLTDQKTEHPKVKHATRRLRVAAGLAIAQATVVGAILAVHANLGAGGVLLLESAIVQFASTALVALAGRPYSSMVGTWLCLDIGFGAAAWLADRSVLGAVRLVVWLPAVLGLGSFSQDVHADLGK